MTTTGLHLDELRVKTTEWLKIWKDSGGKITKFHCHHCKTLQETNQPKKEMVVSRKGYWDSCIVCTKCGGMNMVCVYPNGITKSQMMPLELEETADGWKRKGGIYTYKPTHKH